MFRLNKALDKLKTLECQVTPMLGDFLKHCQTPQQTQATIDRLLQVAEALEKTVGRKEKTFYIYNPITGCNEMILKKYKGKIIFIE